MTEGEQVMIAWRGLGHQFTACRHAAQVSQERLAALTDYSRSTIANVETGRQRVGQDFWDRYDAALHAGGSLRRGYAQVAAAEQAERTRATEQARYESLAIALRSPDVSAA